MNTCASHEEGNERRLEIILSFHGSDFLANFSELYWSTFKCMHASLSTS